MDAIQAVMNPFWGTRDQVPLRGSINTSYTNLGREGITQVAVSLCDEYLKLLARRPIDDGYLRATDGLLPESLKAAAMAQLAAVPLVAEEPNDAAQLAARWKLLKQLAARAPSPELRLVASAVEEAVGGQFRRVREQVQDCFDANPQRLREVVHAVRTVTQRAAVDPPDYAPLTQLGQHVQKLQELAAQTEKITTAACQTATEALLEAGRKEAHQALEEVLCAHIHCALESHRPALLAVLEELEQRSVKHATQLDGMRQRLADFCKATFELQEQRRASVCWHLPGPPREEVLSGMRTASGCQDVHSLVELLSGHYEQALRDRARKSCPHIDAQTASLPTLLAEIPNELLAEEFTKLVAARLGPGYTLYAHIRAAGVDRTVDELWQRSAPTCHLAGRDHERFGLPIYEQAIVRLPAATTTEDEKTRVELANRFRGLDGNCHVTEASPIEQEISVCRMNAGWVIGVEHANHALVERYVEAGQYGHPPHLLGLLSDAELGQASPAYLQLLANHNPPTTKGTHSHEHNGNSS